MVEAALSTLLVEWRLPNVHVEIGVAVGTGTKYLT